MKEARNSFVDSITRKTPFSFGKNKVDSSSSKKEEPISNITKAKKNIPKAEKPEDTVHKREDGKKFKFLEFKRPRLFSWHGSIVILLLLPIMLAGLVSYFYQTHNEGKIYSGVNTFGVDVGSKTREEAGRLVDDKILGYKLNIEGENQKFEATYSDLGISYDKEKILASAYNYGRDESVFTNFFNRAKRFFSQYEVSLGSKKFSFQKHNVNLAYTVNEEKLNKYLTDLEAKINIAPKDSQITTSGTSMQVVPAVFGRKLKTAELKNSILVASTSFESAPLKIQTDVASPTILDEKTRELAEQADKITSKNVILTYQGKTYVPTKAILVSWVTFTRANDSSPWQMVIDPAKMTAYFKTIGANINVYAIDRKVRVENGSKEVVTQEGANGLVMDEGLLGSQISQKLQSDPSVSLTIPMKVAYSQTKKEYIIVANWDKYIDVNLSTQTLEAYEKGGVKKGSWRVTTGKSGYATPTGTSLVSGRSSWIRMKGMEGTSEYYNLYPIKWATWFRPGGYAMHDAYWRSSFGYPGSHGCINMPDSGASFIYAWADVGTPVTAHY
ncbi:MAG: peptidoglycan binding domain-containing protein [Patescibacteria group bacterium]